MCVEISVYLHTRLHVSVYCLHKACSRGPGIEVHSCQTRGNEDVYFYDSLLQNYRNYHKDVCVARKSLNTFISQRYGAVNDADGCVFIAQLAQNTTTRKLFLFDVNSTVIFLCFLYFINILSEYIEKNKRLQVIS